MRVPLGLLMALTIPNAALAQVDLGPFLGGLEKRCEGPEAFDTFVRSMIDRYIATADRPPDRDAPAAIPDFVRPAIGKAVVADKGEYTMIRIPLNGLFRNLQVTGLQLALGHGNGIYAVAVVFASPRMEVEGAIGAEVRAGAEKLRAEFEAGDPIMAIVEADGQTNLVCNLST